jgi:hypothetical protein
MVTPDVDPRRVVGSRVQAKACHVTNLAECARRYGSNAKSAVVFGTVRDVRNTKTNTGRQSTIVVVDFILSPGVEKRAMLNIRSLKSVPAEDPPPELQANNELHPEAAATELHNDTTTNNQATLTGNDVVRDGPTLPGATHEEDTSSTGEEDELPQGPQPAAICHGVAWYQDDGRVLHDINGPFPIRQWCLRTPIDGQHGIQPGSDIQRRYSRLDYFLLMFPPEQLTLMHRLMNQKIRRISEEQRVTYKEMTKGELLKFIGILILATRFEFGRRSTLWSTVAIYKYIPAPQFGKTGMSRHRFDLLFRCLTFSDQPEHRPEGMSAERYRWRLVDDFVVNFNLHRAATFVPSSYICVDESISRWYGLGGDWINMGLPHYVAMERKPENGCEIQNAACGMSGVMLQLKLVKSAQETAAAVPDDDDNSYHSTRVLKDLVQPWTHSDRVVCADSYFASVTTALELKMLGLRFIGVVKTASRKFPMAYLSNIQMGLRGERKGLIACNENGEAIMLAFVWVDRERRYFISSCSSLAEGRPYIRQRWRQIAEGEEDPERVELVVPQPKCAEVYYSTCSAIDKNNRHRQDTLKLERKIETTNWATRVGMSILGMVIVDSWLVYKAATTVQDEVETQAQYYTYLAEELIDNTYDDGQVSRRQRAGGTTPSPEVINRRTGAGRAGVLAHLTPTKRKRKTKDGEVTKHSLQGRCKVCGMKTRFVCSICDDEAQDAGARNMPEMWLCHTETTRMCFPEHLSAKHLST